MKTRRLIISPFIGRIDREFDSGLIRENVGTVNSDGYKVVGVDGKQIRVHRLLYAEHVQGPLAPWHEIDHIDGDRQNNRIENLRRSDRTANSQNQRKCHKDAATGLLGVYWSNTRHHWYSCIHVNGKQKYLGSFSSPEKAHDSYVNAKRQHHAGGTL